MEVWNPMLWEFSRVMRECHRKIGAMLGKNKPPVGQAPITWDFCAHRTG